MPSFSAAVKANQLELKALSVNHEKAVHMLLLQMVHLCKLVDTDAELPFEMISLGAVTLQYEDERLCTTEMLQRCCCQQTVYM